MLKYKYIIYIIIYETLKKKIIKKTFKSVGKFMGFALVNICRKALQISQNGVILGSKTRYI